MSANTVKPSLNRVLWSALVVLMLSSLACSAAVGSRNPTLAPTGAPFITQSPSPTQTETAPPTTESPTPAPTPAVTATLPPPGTVIKITGIVQEIHLDAQVNIIVVDGVRYQVPQQILVLILPNLRVGVPIVFDSRVEAGGVIIIINVVKINNITIIVNPGDHHNDDEGEDGDD